MPSKNPRLMLTLKPETRQRLQRLADLQGLPASTVISQLLDESAPMLEGLCKALEAAKEKRVEAFDHLGETMAQAQAAAAQMQLQLGRARRKAIAKARKAQGGKAGGRTRRT